MLSNVFKIYSDYIIITRLYTMIIYPMVNIIYSGEFA